jgi:hypothetical protein
MHISEHSNLLLQLLSPHNPSLRNGLLSSYVPSPLLPTLRPRSRRKSKPSLHHSPLGHFKIY